MGPPVERGDPREREGRKRRGGAGKGKIVATRCQILMPKCTKIDFGWGSAPDPAGFKGAYF